MLTPTSPIKILAPVADAPKDTPWLVGYETEGGAVPLGQITWWETDVIGDVVEEMTAPPPELEEFIREYLAADDGNATNEWGKLLLAEAKSLASLNRSLNEQNDMDNVGQTRENALVLAHLAEAACRVEEGRL